MWTALSTRYAQRHSPPQLTRRRPASLRPVITQLTNRVASIRPSRITIRSGRPRRSMTLRRPPTKGIHVLRPARSQDERPVFGPGSFVLTLTRHSRSWVNEMVVLARPTDRGDHSVVGDGHAKEVSSVITVQFTAREAQAVAEAILGFMLGGKPGGSFDIKALRAANEKLATEIDKGHHHGQTTTAA